MACSRLRPLVYISCLLISSKALITSPQSHAAELEPVFITSSYLATSWLIDNAAESTSIDNQLIIFPKLLSEDLCQRLEDYLDAMVEKRGYNRAIITDPDSIVHHIIKEEANVLSTVMKSSLEYSDEITYGKENWKEYDKHTGHHYDSMMYGVEASYKVLIYLDDVAGTEFWSSKEDWLQGLPPVTATPSRGTVVFFSMSLFHGSAAFGMEEGMDEEAGGNIIKRTLGMRIKSARFGNRCPAPVSTALRSKREEKEESTTIVTMKDDPDLLVFSRFLPEAFCQELEQYLDALVQQKNRSRGIISVTKEAKERGENLGEGQSNSNITSTSSTILYDLMDAMMPPSFLSAVQYTDLVSYARESGDEYDRFVGPHADMRLNQATHKLQFYLDDNVGKEQFWLTEASYRRLESPYSIVESTRGTIVLYRINMFHDSVFNDEETIRQTLGVRLKMMEKG